MRSKSTAADAPVYFNPMTPLGDVEYLESCKLPHPLALVPVKKYTLPDLTLTRSQTDEIVSGLSEKKFHQLHAFLTNTKGRFLTKMTRLDHEKDHSEVFYNIQLQLNHVKSGKDTVAKVLVDKELFETNCPNCQKSLVEIFILALERSFIYNFVNSESGKGKKEGMVIAIVKNSFVNALDEFACEKLKTIQLAG
jgi:hypothetical protein